MKNSTEILSKNVDRKVAAKILGLKNPNLISMWVGRNFLKQDEVVHVGETKKKFWFSFINIVEMILLKELNEGLNVEYSLGSWILDEAFGLDRKRLMPIIKEGKGYLIVGKTFDIPLKAKGKWDITKSEYSSLKKNEGYQIKITKNRPKIDNKTDIFDHILIINLENAINRALNRN